MNHSIQKLINLLKKQKQKDSEMNNQTQTVRNAINIFIIVAVSISLFQQLINTSQKSNVPSNPTSPTGESIPIEPSGPTIQGIRIQSSDSFQTPLKQILARNKMNIEIVSYEFEGNDYWMNIIVNWGHIVIIFYFMSKHKSETDESKKKQIMIMGAVAVVAWFYFSPKLRPQRFAIEVQGRKVLDRTHLVDQEVQSVLHEHEFEIDDAAEAPSTEPVDAWAERKQEQQAPKTPETTEPVYEEEVF